MKNSSYSGAHGDTSFKLLSTAKINDMIPLFTSLSLNHHWGRTSLYQSDQDNVLLAETACRNDCVWSVEQHFCSPYAPAWGELHIFLIQGNMRPPPALVTHCYPQLPSAAQFALMPNAWAALPSPVCSSQRACSAPNPHMMKAVCASSIKVRREVGSGI